MRASDNSNQNMRAILTALFDVTEFWPIGVLNSMQIGDGEYIPVGCPDVVLQRTDTGCVLTINAVQMADALWMGDDRIRLTVEPGIHGEMWSVMRAMGLRRGPNLLDAETFYNRITDLDRAWALLKRLRKVNHTMQRDLDIVEITCSLMSAVKNWSRIRSIEFESDQSEPSAEWVSFRVWEVSSDPFQLGVLSRIKLEHDPRGAAMRLWFVDDQARDGMHVCALDLNWRVEKSTSGEESGLNVFEVSSGVSKSLAVPFTKVPEAVREVMRAARVVDNKVILTRQLSAKLYASVNEWLNLLGGKWHTGQQAHVFDGDPSAQLGKLIDTGRIQTRKDFEFFWTPDWLAQELAQDMGLKGGMRVLDPQAGSGVLAKAAAQIVGQDNVVCLDLMPENFGLLKAHGWQMLTDEPTDFLALQPRSEFSGVITNPPFSGGRDIAHTMQAWKWLKPGGVLGGIVSTSSMMGRSAAQKQFIAFIEAHAVSVENIDAGAFADAGTMVATKKLVLHKPKTENHLVSAPVTGVLAKPVVHRSAACDQGQLGFW